jgi:hypothetical protein
MPEHKIGTPEDWHAALKRLANLEAEHARLSQKVTVELRQLPCARLSPVLQAPPECSASSKGDRISRCFRLLATRRRYGKRALVPRT